MNALCYVVIPMDTDNKELSVVKFPAYIVRSCKRCVNYWPKYVEETNTPPDPCTVCRRYYHDYFEERKE